MFYFCGFMRKWLFLLLLLFQASLPGWSRISVAKYEGVTLPDSAVVNTGFRHLRDSVVARHQLFTSARIISDIEVPHVQVSQTADFYLLLLLCLMLGIIRFVDPRYFYNLWLAFTNPTLSNRQLKDQLLGAGIPNFLMNVFFSISVGAYIYYIVKYFTPHRSGVIPSSLLILMLIAGTAIIYLSKYVAVRFSGWAFRMEGLTEHYLFNVFLINKILGIILVPFIIVLAFADQGVVQQMVFISFVVAGVLILNRYVRSWQVFGAFFQYSKFHFFMYLCASEILPLAVLMKLLVKGLLFY